MFDRERVLGLLSEASLYFDNKCKAFHKLQDVIKAVRKRAHRREGLVVYCPVCEKAVELTAISVNATVKADVSYDVVTNQGDIEWDNCDISGDFEYHCSECDTLLSKSLDELGDKQHTWLSYKGGNNEKVD